MRVQIAALALAAAQERHPQSSGKYRLEVIAEEYPKQMKFVCSESHPGGALIFPVKRRSQSDGGDWTAETSAARRIENPKSIMNQGTDAFKVANNRYNPLHRMTLVNGALPSGWDLDQVAKPRTDRAHARSRVLATHLARC